SEPHTNIDINVWPQPAKDQVSFALNGKVGAGQIYILNVSGQLVKTLVINSKGKVDVDISSFASGIYLYQVHTEQGLVTGKLIKQ
ncbi:T9SS type A sorting domain-containing protein, partial [Salinivirga cyanobacteriivorans]